MSGSTPICRIDAARRSGSVFERIASLHPRSLTSPEPTREIGGGHEGLGGPGPLTGPNRRVAKRHEQGESSVLVLGYIEGAGEVPDGVRVEQLPEGALAGPGGVLEGLRPVLGTAIQEMMGQFSQSGLGVRGRHGLDRFADPAIEG